MDRFRLMQVFTAVAEQQSFVAAARQLNISAPAVTRAITALESTLGVRLLLRTTRHLRLTDAGQQYLQDARRILEAVSQAEDSARGRHSSPSGHLTVTAPSLFGRYHVMPYVVDYLRQYPDMRVTTLLLDRVVNLMEEGVDVAIRIGELADSSEYAVAVGKVFTWLVASPDYLEKQGIPSDPEQLRQHTLIAATTGDYRQEGWAFQTASGRQAFRYHPRLLVTTNDAARVAAESGFGITQLLSYQVADAIAAGRLVRVLTDYELPPIPVNVVYRSGQQAPTKVRTFVDALVTSLRELDVIQ